MASSIREIVKLDGDFLAVTESDRVTRFRIWCGPVTVCAPGKGELLVRLREPSNRGLIDRIQAADGSIHGAEKTAVPNGEWVGIPIARLEEFRDEALEGHRQLLPEAIDAGKNPNLARGRDDLREYLLSEGTPQGND